MNKQVNVAQLQDGMAVDSIYVIRSIDRGKKKNGADFIRLVLADATGEINCVAWDNIDDYLQNKIRKNDFVRISGSVGTYQDQKQMTIIKSMRIEPSKVDLQDFVPHTPFDIEDLKKQLLTFVEKINDEHYRAVVDYFFKNTEFFNKFCAAPSARMMHQAYMGGLLEHTVGVCKNAVAIADNYKGCNYHLLLTGALLHDIGKIREYILGTSIEYTDDGRLRGHLVISAEMAHDAMDKIPGFPEEKKMLLEHLIFSHHGQREWGSPRRPKTMEALILHWADYIDAYLSTYLAVVKKTREQGYRWSEWNKMFERYLFAGFDEPLAEAPTSNNSEMSRDALES